MCLKELSARTSNQTAHRWGPLGLTWVRGCEHIVPGGNIADSTVTGHVRLCAKMSQCGLSGQGLGISKVMDLAVGRGRMFVSDADAPTLF